MGYYVELLAFSKSDHAFSSTALGDWTSETSDRAMDWLRLFVERSFIHMSEAAARSARKWVRDRAMARRALDTLDNGGMYVHVISDGSTHYEISARPLLASGADPERHGTEAPEEASKARELTSAWSVPLCRYRSGLASTSRKRRPAGRPRPT